jgi:septum formation protein
MQPSPGSHQPEFNALPLILASQSPRRRALLQQLLPAFEVVPSDAEEHLDHDAGPCELAVHNARIKAVAVGRQFPNRWILASDTVVDCDGVSLAKPADRQEAMDMLRTLSGRSHQVHTGVVLHKASEGIEDEAVETTTVRFFKLADATLAHYADTMQPGQYAGGYPIQFLLGTLVAGFDGSYSNVVGLPLEAVASLLRARGIVP